MKVVSQLVRSNGYDDGYGPLGTSAWHPGFIYINLLKRLQPSLLHTQVRKKAPSTLIVVDGVCSFGAESLYFDDWGIDFVLTASQKALGVPPGRRLSNQVESYPTGTPNGS